MSNERRRPFPFDQFEPYWQRVWDERQAFHAPNPGEPDFDASKPFEDVQPEDVIASRPGEPECDTRVGHR